MSVFDNMEPVFTGERRHSPITFEMKLSEIPPDNPPRLTDGMFQKKYELRGILSCCFWANDAQIDGKTEQAKKAIKANIYSDVIPHIEAALLSAEDEDTRRHLMAAREAMK